MAVTTRTIIGRVLDAARKPTLDGEYRFTPTQEMVTTSGDFIPKRPTIARFTSGDGADAGKFTVDLIANDSDDLAQTAGTWRVQLVLDSRPGRIQREWNIVVPKEGSGTGANGTGPIELGDLTQVTEPGEVAYFLTEAAADDRYVQPAALNDFVRTDDLEAVPGIVLQDDLAPYAKAGATQTLLKVQAGTPDAMVTGAIVRDGNGAATGFDVLWPDGATGRFAGTPSPSFPGAIDAYTITHVLGGVTQTYTQAAVTRNASGAVTTRPAIAVTNGAPVITPVAPTMTLSAKTDTSVTVAGSGGQNVASLVVRRGSVTVATAFPFTDSGLTQNTTVTYTCTATSSDGTTATSTLTVTTNVTPVIPIADALTATAGAAGSGQITITGSGATGAASKALYRSPTSPVDTTGTPVATSLPFTDTGRGTTQWFYREVVTSSTGHTAASNTVNATVAGAADTTAPTAPTTVTATPGVQSATVTFSGATDNTAVTTHKVYTAPSGGSAVATGNSPLQVTGLTAGTAYTFYVSALDAAGNESARTASNSVTPTAAGSYPAAGTVFLADNFTAADGAAIEGRTLPDGTDTTKAWAHATDARFLVNSNRARAATGPTGQSAYAMVDTGFTKYKATITVPVLLTSTSMRKIGLVAAFVDTANTLRLDANGGTWLLRKIIAGTATTLITGPTAAAADVATLTIAADGTLSVTVNGTTVGTTSTLPTELNAATKAGVYGQPTSGSSGGTVQDQTSAIADIAFTAV